MTRQLTVFIALLSSQLLSNQLLSNRAFATEAIDLRESLWPSTVTVVDGWMEYDHHGGHGSDVIATMRYVVKVKVRCLREDLAASRFTSEYTRFDGGESFVRLQVLTSYDPRGCAAGFDDREFVVRSRNNTTNRASAPRAIVVNGFRIPVEF